MSRALINLFRKTGARILPFKPYGTNDLWSNYELVSRNLKDGRLLGGDAGALARAAATDLPLELLNTDHSLSRSSPTDAAMRARRRKPPVPQPFATDRILRRVSTVVQQSPLRLEHKFFVFDDNTNRPIPDCVQAFINHITTLTQTTAGISLHRVSMRDIASPAAYWDDFRAEGCAAARTCDAVISREAEIIVYESFGPFTFALDNLNGALAVEPYRVRWFSADQFASAAARDASARHGHLAIVDSDAVLDALETVAPLASAPWSPGTDAERDQLAEAAVSSLNLRSHGVGL